MIVAPLLTFLILSIDTNSFTSSTTFAERRACYVSSKINVCTNTSKRKIRSKLHAHNNEVCSREVDVCIIGGGMSGLAAAITTAEKSIQHRHKQPSILILESDSDVGGRVRSDYTSDGFILDRGFAVFIEQYPMSKKLLDYDALELQQFLPGARVKLVGKEKLASVSDPLRRPRDILKVITSPVGSPRDKIRLLPLFYTVMKRSIGDLFEMEETDTLTCLKKKYNFSDDFINEFFAPFLEGIYLTPLDKQSSRMLHFVMKMFTIGSTSLPRKGMQAVSDQLGDRAINLGADIRCNTRALSLKQESSSDKFVVEVDSEEHGKHEVQANSIIVATEGEASRNLLQSVTGLEQSLKQLPKVPQRSVGCIYYAFQSPAPLIDPILILNGEGKEQQRNTKDFPINNCCFPSVVQRDYAPEGYELCSVSILEQALSDHDGDHASLDTSVRKHLSTWFPDHANDIMDEKKWVQKGIYIINNAQPAHFGTDGCASIHGGRDCSVFQGVVSLPNGIFVSGDYMATSTFNGALESGVNAGETVARFLADSLVPSK